VNLDSRGIWMPQLKRETVRQRPSMGTVSHIFDRPWVPTAAFLLVGQALAYEFFVPFPRTSVLAFAGLLSILVGATGVSLILLRRRWSYGRILALGALAVLIVFSLGLVAGYVEFLESLLRYIVPIGYILAFGAIGAGFRYVIFGPFIIDKSSRALSNTR
jgi:hypothetical protein